MKKGKILFTLFFLVLYCLKSSAQSPQKTYSEIYNLHFTMKLDSGGVYPWMDNLAYVSCSMPGYAESSDRLLYRKMYTKGFPFTDRLRSELYQRILLPIHSENEGRIEVECKGQNLKSVSLLLDGISREEKIVCSDTIQFIPDTCLSTVSHKFALNNVELLNIRIQAEGVPNENADIIFSGINIWIGGKSIDEFPVRELPTLSLPENISYIPINSHTGEGLGEIDNLKNHRIIGLGESIHGNSSIKNLKNQIILEAIEKQNCRLVLLEMPLEASLAYNRFIHDEQYVIDSLLFPGQLIDPQMQDLLGNLRLYNSRKKEADKVRLLGMDYNSVYSSTQNSSITIFDFVTQLNESGKIPEVDEFALLLMEKDWSAAVAFLKSHQTSIQQLLTADEIDCITHILTLSQKMGEDQALRTINRDSVMFLNTKFLIEKYSYYPDAKTVICAHTTHLNPVSTYPALTCKPFGAYLKETYGDDFTSLLFLIANGETIASDLDYYRKYLPLKESPENSLEYLLSSFDATTFFLPLTPDFNKLVVSRFIGSHYSYQEFFPYNLYQRAEGVFFIKGAKQHLSDKSGLLISEFLNRTVSIYKRRQEVLGEIQKRKISSIGFNLNN